MSTHDADETDNESAENVGLRVAGDGHVEWADLPISASDSAAGIGCTNEISYDHVMAKMRGAERMRDWEGRGFGVWHLAFRA